MKELTLDIFLKKTASDEAVPGGGSVSALCGALSTALSEMVSKLTASNGKYEDVSDEMKSLGAEAEVLRNVLTEDIKKDSEAFAAVMQAYAMPKSSEEEKASRKNEIQRAYKMAADVPLTVARDCCKALEIARVMASKGNENARTDGLVAAMCARTGGLGALYNVWINLEAIKDEEYVNKMRKEVYSLGEKIIMSERKILSGYSLKFEL